MSPPVPPSPRWSFLFLKITAGLMLLSPLIGVLIYLLISQTTGSTERPLDIAIRGAKTVGLIGAFLAPLVALILVTREVNQQAAREKQSARSPDRID
jgi:uncharacterized membrane protein